MFVVSGYLASVEDEAAEFMTHTFLLSISDGLLYGFVNHHRILQFFVATHKLLLFHHRTTAYAKSHSQIQWALNHLKASANCQNPRFPRHHLELAFLLLHIKRLPRQSKKSRMNPVGRSIMGRYWKVLRDKGKAKGEDRRNLMGRRMMVSPKRRLFKSKLKPECANYSD